MHSAPVSSQQNLNYTDLEKVQYQHCMAHMFLSEPYQNDHQRIDFVNRAIEWLNGNPSGWHEKGKFKLNLTQLSILNHHIEFFGELLNRGKARFFEMDSLGSTAFTRMQESPDPRFSDLFYKTVRSRFENVQLSESQQQTYLQELGKTRLSLNRRITEQQLSMFEISVWYGYVGIVAQILNQNPPFFLRNPISGLSPYDLACIRAQDKGANRVETTVGLTILEFVKRKGIPVPSNEVEYSEYLTRLYSGAEQINEDAQRYIMGLQSDLSEKTQLLQQLQKQLEESRPAPAPASNSKQQVEESQNTTPSIEIARGPAVLIPVPSAPRVSGATHSLLAYTIPGSNNSDPTVAAFMNRFRTQVDLEDRGSMPPPFVIDLTAGSSPQPQPQSQPQSQPQPRTPAEPSDCKQQ